MDEVRDSMALKPHGACLGSGWGAAAHFWTEGLRGWSLNGWPFPALVKKVCVCGGGSYKIWVISCT